LQYESRVETQTDSYLMQLVQTGDTGRLAVLFERHHAALFRYLLSLTSDRALSEDLTQEVFFRALKYSRSYDPDQPFAVWLYSLGRNAWFDTRRKRRPETADDGLEEIRSSEPMPEELFTRKQDVEFLRAALHRLPEDKREVLVLSRFHGLRYEEIGRILECEAGTVKVRVYRALKELRSAFCALRGEKL
jgi:RNA polymerase sigma-70 factor (ECF subfamily)